jgi:hypothetical protein
MAEARNAKPPGMRVPSGWEGEASGTGREGGRGTAGRGRAWPSPLGQDGGPVERALSVMRMC